MMNGYFRSNVASVLFKHCLSFVLFFILSKTIIAEPFSYDLSIEVAHKDNSGKTIWFIQEKKNVTTFDRLVPSQDKNWSSDKLWTFKEESPKELLKEYIDKDKNLKREIYIRSKVVVGERNSAVLAVQYNIFSGNKKISEQNITLMLPFGDTNSMEVKSLTYFKEGKEEGIKSETERVKVTATAMAH
ncbi:MAG: hypothetical protein HQK54_16185 [Oligoflexales bacterium]|nr:hypothetical protein [Oligoflexales bacterium]